MRRDHSAQGELYFGMVALQKLARCRSLPGSGLSAYLDQQRGAHARAHANIERLLTGEAPTTPLTE